MNDTVIQMKMCRCGRAPHRPKARNCHLCNREAHKRYRAAIKGSDALVKAIREIKDAGGSTPPGYVYFVRSGERGLIKIGFSIDPRERVKQLQTNSPFQLYFLGAVPAQRALEHLFHTRFSPYRMQGEWFEPVPEILRMIEELIGSTNTGMAYG